jgi:nucleoside phosphorylase
MSDDPPPPPSRDDFEVAVICALGPEGAAVEALFDKVWHDAGNTIGRESSDKNTYTMGLIGRHYVVLIWMPDIGKINAARVAVHLLSSFTKIKLVLVVGICGGVPHKADGEEILLGDVIISTALKKYDSGRQYPNKYLPREAMCKPDSEIRSLLTKLEASSSRNRLREISFGYVEELLSKEDFLKVRYPGAQEDKLYEPTYLHKHHGVSGCGVCTKDEKKTDMVCDDATDLTCMELKCDESLLVPRTRLEKIKKAAAVEAAKAPNPAIHFGVMASGDTVMKSGEHRDQVAKREKVIAFEMEGAGVFDIIPSIVVIKGVCDYADSHKNKKWQAYAAATAAAYMKAFLKLKDEILGMLPARIGSIPQTEGDAKPLPFTQNFDPKTQQPFPVPFPQNFSPQNQQPFATGPGLSQVEAYRTEIDPKVFENALDKALDCKASGFSTILRSLSIATTVNEEIYTNEVSPRSPYPDEAPKTSVVSVTEVPPPKVCTRGPISFPLLYNDLLKQPNCLLAVIRVKLTKSPDQLSRNNTTPPGMSGTQSRRHQTSP